MTDVSRPEAEPPRASGSRRLKYALIASLALNLLILGAIAGTMFVFGKHERLHGYGRGEDFGLMGLTRVLPEERRKEFRKQLGEARARLRPLMDDISTARREAADKLAAEPFDKAALEAALDKVGEKQWALRKAGVAAFLGHVEHLNNDERRMLADWWRKKATPPKRKAKASTEKTESVTPPAPPTASSP